MLGIASSGWMSPSPRLWTMRCAQVGGTAGIVALAAGVSAASAANGAAGGVVAAAVIACGGLALWFVRNRVRAWAYHERDEDLVVSRACSCTAFPWFPTDGCSSWR